MRSTNVVLLGLSSLAQVTTAFTHPGLLATDLDLARARTKIAANRDPWLSSYYALCNSSFASANYSLDNAVATIYRGSDGVHADNSATLYHDAAAAFALALRWQLSGDEAYAARAAGLLQVWAGNLTAIGGDMDAYLVSGLQGHELANAAELLRGYAPFTAAGGGWDSVVGMLEGVFAPMNMAFLQHELPAEHVWTHYFANWELANMASAMAIAVVGGNETMWEFVVDYAQNGTGNGCLQLAVSNLVPEPGNEGVLLGQGQESGRDQGHSALDQQMLGVVGQQAWNQGVDLFGFNDSRILKGAEYFARYNLGYDVPFVNYTNSIVFYDQISNASRGATRPTWELLYSHYVQIKGLDAPWTTEYLNYTLAGYGGGFEPGAGSLGEGSGNYDGLGWGSLLYHMDEEDVVAYKSNMTAGAVSNSTQDDVETVARTGHADADADADGHNGRGKDRHGKAKVQVTGELEHWWTRG